MPLLILNVTGIFIAYRSAGAADSVVAAVPRLVVDLVVARVQDHVVRTLRRRVHRLEPRHVEGGEP